MKQCIQCNVVKESESFYRHSKMSDGRLNKCKQCCLEYYKDRRTVYPDKIRAIELKRSQKPKRKNLAQQYQKRSRKNNPLKYIARTAVGNALRDGKISKQPCQKCGSSLSEAHHSDYSQPLNVIWLCKKHHFEAHKTTI
jgi:hypothetical protein